MSIHVKRDQIQGKAMPIHGNEIDTDRIIPARYLKEISFEKMGDYLFYDVRYDHNGNPAPDFPLNQDKYNDATIMIVQNNFGCGSSREHAPQSIKRYGFKAIIGESFAEIFSGNCKALGMPAVCAEKDVIRELISIVESDPNANIAIDLNTNTVTVDTNNTKKEFPIQLEEEKRNAFIEGTWDEIAILNANSDKIREKAHSLSYFNF